MNNIVSILVPTGGTAALVAIAVRLLAVYTAALRDTPDTMRRRLFWTPLAITFVFSLATLTGAIYLTDLRARRRSEDVARLALREAADAQAAFVYTCYQANALRAESAARGQSGAELFEVLRASQIITDRQVLLAIDKAIIDLTRTGSVLDCTWPPIHTTPQPGGATTPTTFGSTDG